MPNFTIGKVAKAAGVNVETIRFYERKGLIERPRSEAGPYRVYPQSIVHRVLFIQRVKALGFSLDEISELLKINDAGPGLTDQTRDNAEKQLATVEFKQVELASLRTALESLLNSPINGINKLLDYIPMPDNLDNSES